MRNKKKLYPFTAIVGQKTMKKALILNVINPNLGGVLIRGEKGTAKSTAVRAFEELLPEKDEIEGCIFGCDPYDVSSMCDICLERYEKGEEFSKKKGKMKVIDLPVSATEDRVVGTLDIEHAIKKGEKKFEPGILAMANRNILYVDEVNLLSESIVNSILEVSQSGINHVEREGISFTHDCSFVLIGTMNPEEGGLRPQLLDRFGLYVDVVGSEDLNERVKIIKRRIEYENDPLLFTNKWKEEDEKIWSKIEKARELILDVKVSEDAMKLASEISLRANCSGHRAEIVIVEAAKAIAVLDGRKNITIEDLKEASELALPHRMRDIPPNVSESEEEKEDENNEEDRQDQGSSNEELENQETLDETPLEEEQEEEFQDDNDDTEYEDDEDDNREDTDDMNNSQSSDEESIDKIGDIFKVKDLDIKPLDRRKRKGSGRRSIIKTGELQGRYVRYTFPKGKPRDIAFGATLRAAAPYQSSRDKNGLALAIREYDLREKVREKRTGSTILFVVDASGSMGAQKRMEAVKGAIMSLLTDAYQKRDSVGMVAFRKEEAELILGITRSVDLAHKKLEELPTGGKTPLSLGIYRGYKVLKAAIKKDPDIIPVMVLVTDGRGNTSFQGKDPHKEALEVAEKIASEGIQNIVIDTEEDYIKLHLAEEIAMCMNANYYRLEDLRADEIFTFVKNSINFRKASYFS